MTSDESDALNRLLDVARRSPSELRAALEREPAEVTADVCGRARRAFDDAARAGDLERAQRPAMVAIAAASALGRARDALEMHLNLQQIVLAAASARDDYTLAVATASESTELAARSGWDDLVSQGHLLAAWGALGAARAADDDDDGAPWLLRALDHLAAAADGVIADPAAWGESFAWLAAEVVGAAEDADWGPREDGAVTALAALSTRLDDAARRGDAG